MLEASAAVVKRSGSFFWRVLQLTIWLGGLTIIAAMLASFIVSGSKF